MRKYCIGLSLLTGCLITFGTTVSGMGVPKNGSAKTYLQESMVRVRLSTEKSPKIVKLIQTGEGVAAISPDELYFFRAGKWSSEPLKGNWQTGGLDTGGKLWVAGEGVIQEVGRDRKLLLPAEAAKDTIFSILWEDADNLWVGTGKGLWHWKEQWQKFAEFKNFAVRQVEAGTGNEVWAATSGGLFRRIDHRWVNLSYAVMAPGLGINYFCVAKGSNSADMWFGGQWAVGKIAGDGDHALFSADDGLPYAPITCIAISGKSRWYGTPKGAICQTGKQWHYYAGKRWLDQNSVLDILPIDSNRVWVATSTGINELRKQPMTLEQKALYFDKRLNERHLHYGFASECRFKSLQDTTEFSHSTNDNDGLWTSIYLAAECFRYAVTGEKSAYDNAVRTFLAMEKLQTVNPISGYVARSYVSIDESTGEGGEWHVSADGKWKWKGDTSSDEIVGHMFAYPLFYDLVAKGEMKSRVKSVVDKLMTHIVDHNFQLVDLDGIATRWAVWTPDSLNHSQRWMYEKGINSLQILAFLKTAVHVTGNAKYEAAYDLLAKKHHYLENMAVQKMYGPYEINHSDDELSFLPYYLLMRYGKDSPDKLIYAKSLLRSWKAEENDRIPLWNLIASIGLGKNCGLGVAKEELELIPLDIRSWWMANSHRLDLQKSAVKDRFFKDQATRPIPTPERAISKWNTNTYQLDAGGDGLSEDDGAYFLLPYWMGRWHGLVE